MKTNTVIIDDHEATLFGYVGYLDKNAKDLEVTFQATSIAKTYSFLEKNRVDLLILDMCFPPKFSIENTINYIKYVKKEQKNCSILIITGYAPKSSIKKALMSGADYIHIKGSLSDFLKDVRKTMDISKRRRNKKNKLTEEEIEIEEWEYLSLPEVNNIEKKILENANRNSDDIAKEVKKSIATVERYIRDLKTKLGLKNKQDLYAFYKVNEDFF